MAKPLPTKVVPRHHPKRHIEELSGESDSDINTRKHKAKKHKGGGHKKKNKRAESSSESSSSDESSSDSSDEDSSSSNESSDSSNESSDSESKFQVMMFAHPFTDTTFLGPRRGGKGKKTGRKEKKKSKGSKGSSSKKDKKKEKRNHKRRDLRPRLYNYPNKTQKLIKYASRILRSTIFNSTPFADDEALLAATINAWDTACKEMKQKKLPDDDGRIFTVVS